MRVRVVAPDRREARARECRGRAAGSDARARGPARHAARAPSARGVSSAVPRAGAGRRTPRDALVGCRGHRRSGRCDERGTRGPRRRRDLPGCLLDRRVRRVRRLPRARRERCVGRSGHEARPARPRDRAHAAGGIRGSARSAGRAAQRPCRTAPGRRDDLDARGARPDAGLQAAPRSPACPHRRSRSRHRGARVRDRLGR